MSDIDECRQEIERLKNALEYSKRQCRDYAIAITAVYFFTIIVTWCPA